MKLKHSFILILLSALLHAANAQKDSVPKMSAFVSLNIGGGINMSSISNTSFYGENSTFLSASGVIPFKNSNLGIPICLGYSTPAFNNSSFYAPQINIALREADGFEYDSAHYTILYIMSGINYNIPTNTKHWFCEINLMAGLAVVTQPYLTSTFYDRYASVSANPPPSPYVIYNVNAATCYTLAISGGVHFMYIISNHIGFSFSLDVLYANLKFNTIESTNSYGRGYTNQTLNIITNMQYMTFGIGLVYSL